MKKTILLFSIILTLSLCSCVNSQTANTQSTTSNQQTTTDSVSEPTSVPATEQPKQKNKGTVSGKYDVEIVTAKTATDFQGNPAIIVTYNFTNNSNANASFLTSVSANAFQNSIQCNVATMMPRCNGRTTVISGSTTGRNYHIRMCIQFARYCKPYNCTSRSVNEYNKRSKRTNDI